MAEHHETIRAYVAQLQGLVAELQEIAEQSRAILSAHRRPGGITKTELVEQLMQLLEGEQWRRAEELRNKICAGCHKGTAGKHRLKAISRQAKRTRLEKREALAGSFNRKATSARARRSGSRKAVPPQ